MLTSSRAVSSKSMEKRSPCVTAWSVVFTRNGTSTSLPGAPEVSDKGGQESNLEAARARVRGGGSESRGEGPRQVVDLVPHRFLGRSRRGEESARVDLGEVAGDASGVRDRQHDRRLAVSTAS